MWTRVRGLFAILFGALAIGQVQSGMFYFEHGAWGWILSIGLIVWGLYLLVMGDSRKNAAQAAALARIDNVPGRGVGRLFGMTK